MSSTETTGTTTTATAGGGPATGDTHTDAGTADSGRRGRFEADVASSVGAPAPRRARGGARITGVIAMIVGTVATFVVYVASLTLADPRDLASYQMLALGFVALIVVGAAMFVAATTTEAIRLWSLRRLVESRAQGDRLAAALGERDAASDGQGVGR